MSFLSSFSVLVISLCLVNCGATYENDEPDHKKSSGSEFVQVIGSQFALNGQPYYYAGTNMWYGAYLGADTEVGDRARLIKELDILKARGITNLRILAVSETSDLPVAVSPAVLLSRSGELNEILLQGLDFLLVEMSKRDMKAVLYLGNFWEWSGGMGQYVSWFTGNVAANPGETGLWNEFMENSAQFYRIPEAQDLYHAVAKKIITRTNTINGKAYNNDPTIMSWQLANEPRPGSDIDGHDHKDEFITWISDSAAYIKSLAPKQLLSTGNEGIMGSIRDETLFERAHSSPDVDYLTFHMWIKNWGWFDINNPEETYPSTLIKANEYLQKHVALARKMGKPIVLEEFGVERNEGGFDAEIPTIYRDKFYAYVLDFVYANAEQNGVFAGSNFWAWGGFGRTKNADYMWKKGDVYTGDPPQEAQGLNSVFDTDDSTLSIIQRHAEKMQALAK